MNIKNPVIPALCLALLITTSGCTTETHDAFQPVTSVHDCIARERPFSIVTQTAPSGLYIFIPQPFVARTMLLERVETASGERYEGEDVMAWTKGDEAMFAIDDVTVTDCTNNPEAAYWEAAKINGADFRAVGRNPDWVLEIREREQVTLTIGDTDSINAMAADIVRNPNARETVFHARDGADELQITLTGAECSLGNEPAAFATTVSIDYNNTTYSGCGRSLH